MTLEGEGPKLPLNVGEQLPSDAASDVRRTDFLATPLKTSKVGYLTSFHQLNEWKLSCLVIEEVLSYAILCNVIEENYYCLRYLCFEGSSLLHPYKIYRKKMKSTRSIFPQKHLKKSASQ